MLRYDIPFNLFMCVNADGFHVYSKMRADSIHYLALTSVLGQRTYAVCLTQFTKYSVSKVRFSVHN